MDFLVYHPSGKTNPRSKLKQVFLKCSLIFYFLFDPLFIFCWKFLLCFSRSYYWYHFTSLKLVLRGKTVAVDGHWLIHLFLREYGWVERILSSNSLKFTYTSQEKPCFWGKIHLDLLIKSSVSLKDFADAGGSPPSFSSILNQPSAHSTRPQTPKEPSLNKILLIVF